MRAAFDRKVSSSAPIVDITLKNSIMTVMECVGCTLIAYGIPFSMFVFTIAHHPFRIIIAMTR